MGSDVLVFKDKESAISTVSHCLDIMDLEKEDKFFSIRKLEEGFVVAKVDLNKDPIEVEPIMGNTESGGIILDT